MYMLVLTLVLLLISGAALFGALVVTRKARRDVENRITLVIGTPIAKHGGTNFMLSASGIEDIGAELRALFTLGLQRRWGMRADNATLVMIGLVAAALVWLAVRLALGLTYWITAPLVIGAFLYAPQFRIRQEQRKAEKEFMNTFPDTIDMIVRMLRAGLPITAAIQSIGQEAPPPVSAVFSMLSEQIAIGIPLNEALDAVGGRIGLPDFRFFAVAVSLQYATGGNLASTLDTLADIMRKRRSVRLKTQSATAEVRLSAYVLGALPPFVVCVLLVLNPAYLAPLVKDPRGHVIVAMALLNLFIAFLSMRQMMRSVTASGS